MYVIPVYQNACLCILVCSKPIKITLCFPPFFVFISVGKVWKPKKSEELRKKEEEEKNKNEENVNLGEEWEEALANATEEDLVDLAGG